MIFMTDMKHKLDKYGKCPVCSADWDGGSILETFLEQKKKGHWANYTEEQIAEYVNDSYSEPRKWSELIYIHKQGEPDAWMCPGCECEFTIGETNNGTTTDSSTTDSKG